MISILCYHLDYMHNLKNKIKTSEYSKREIHSNIEKTSGYQWGKEEGKDIIGAED